SRIEEGRRPMKLRRADLSDLVREVTGGQRRFLEDRGFSLVVRTPEEPVELPFDAQAIEQVLVNLIDNAVKFTEAGSVEVEVEVAEARALGPAEGDRARCELHFAVRDTGIGIPERKAMWIVCSSRSRRPTPRCRGASGGTGLGLTISKRLCEGLGGGGSGWRAQWGAAPPSTCHLDRALDQIPAVDIVLDDQDPRPLARVGRVEAGDGAYPHGRAPFSVYFHCGWDRPAQIATKWSFLDTVSGVHPGLNGPASNVDARNRIIT
ncbi:MAG: ATP-binding protein, partial [Myxococcota bacterium]